MIQERGKKEDGNPQNPGEVMLEVFTGVCLVGMSTALDLEGLVPVLLLT